MKHLDLAQTMSSARLVTPIAFRELLSESEILQLHDMLLTNGLHYIKTSDVSGGRELILTLLQSLKHYQVVACLTTENRALDQDICNVFEELTSFGYLHDGNLEEYFVERTYFDFMWIEATPNLLASPWFNIFLKHLIDFNVDQHMPIIILTN